MSCISEDQPEGQKLKIVLLSSLNECLKVIKVKCYNFFFVYVNILGGPTGRGLVSLS